MSFFYIVSKIFITFFLPPGLFVTLLLFGYLFIKNLRKFTLFLVVFFWVLSSSFFASLLLYPLEEPYRIHKPLANSDFVVVLGGGVGSEDVDFKLSPGALKRALLGVELAKGGNIPLVYSGGGNKKTLEAHGFVEDINRVYKPFGISIELKDSLQGSGFYLLIESKSLNTYQNAKYLKEMFESYGIERPKVALVSSAYHLNRATTIFNSLGFNTLGYGADFQSDGIAYSFRDFFPSSNGLNGSFVALKEYFGTLSLILR
ncbi:MAG: YdcF family protein [Campylobacterales bacterium]